MAAAILASDNAAQTWRDFEKTDGKIKPQAATTLPPTQARVLNINQQLMDYLVANATRPFII